MKCHVMKRNEVLQIRIEPALHARLLRENGGEKLDHIAAV